VSTADPPGGTTRARGLRAISYEPLMRRPKPSFAKLASRPINRGPADDVVWQRTRDTETGAAAGGYAWSGSRRPKSCGIRCSTNLPSVGSDHGGHAEEISDPAPFRLRARPSIWLDPAPSAGVYLT
jgi:hypothetical protein